MTLGDRLQQRSQLGRGLRAALLASDRPHAFAEKVIEHILRPPDHTRAPPARSAFGLAACGVVTRPGTAPTGRPIPCASRAVTNDPDRSPASTTTVIAASAAMMRLRAGNIHRRTLVPGAISDTAAPVATIRRCRARLPAG